MENITEENQPKKSCKKCKTAETLKSIPKSTVILTIFLLFATVYGTIEIIKDIISLF